ncbi:protein of unknown function [Desulfovibrio sp. 86]|nr:protein of unknown function [Desulfovibrio sp. 86]
MFAAIMLWLITKDMGHLLVVAKLLGILQSVCHKKILFYISMLCA